MGNTSNKEIWIAEKNPAVQVTMQASPCSGIFLWQILLILFLSIAVYANSLSGEFVWDDTAQIVESKSIKTLANTPYSFTKSIGESDDKISNYYRPLFNISLSVDHALWKLHPLGFHITNVFLHALVSLLVFLTARMLVKDDTTAFIAAVLFAVHPVHAEAVSWISARGHLLAAVFLLTSLYSYATFRTGDKGWYLVLSLATFFFALMSIEMAITLPGVIILYEALINKKSTRLRYIVFFAAALAFYLLIRNIVLAEFTLDVDTLPLFSRLFTAPIITIRYILAFVFPFGLKAGYDLKPVASIIDPGFLISAALLAVIIWSTVVNAKKHNFIAFGILWFFITITPVLSIVKQVHPMPMSLRYLYIPSIGLSIAMATVLNSFILRLRSKYMKLAMAAAVIVLSLITLHENSKWSDDVSLFKQMVTDNRESAVAHFYLGSALLKHDQHKEALLELQKSLEVKTDRQIHPRLRDIYLKLSIVFYRQKQFEEAVSMATTALKYKPDYPEVYNILGNIYADDGQLDTALQMYQTAVNLKPAYAEAYYNIGTVYEKQGRLEDALSGYMKTISIDPDMAKGHHNIGHLKYMAGNYGEAIEYFKKAVEKDPRYARAFNMLGLSYIETGEHSLALENFNEAIALDPGLYPAYNNRGMVYAIKGEYMNAIKEFGNAIQINPSYGEGYDNRGMAYMEMNQKELAEKDFGNACRLGFRKACSRFRDGKTGGEMSRQLLK